MIKNGYNRYIPFKQRTPIKLWFMTYSKNMALITHHILYITNIPSIKPNMMAHIAPIINTIVLNVVIIAIIIILASINDDTISIPLIVRHSFISMPPILC